MSSSRQRDSRDLVDFSEDVPTNALDQVNPPRKREAFAWFYWLKSHVDRRHTPYSFVSAMAAFILFLTIVIDVVFSADAGITPAVHVLLLALSAASTIVPLVMGRRYPPWAGLIPVAIIAAATLYFVGFSNVDQSVVSSLQELPIVALYLGWFYRGWPARCIMIVFSVCIFVAILMSSSFGGNGHFPIPIGVASIAIMAFCFEAGSYLQRELEQHAIHDHLTGVLNRRGFSERFEIERARSRRLGSTLTVAVIDFDHFKRVNDELGHAAGDELLRSSVRVWSIRIFDSDALGRLGGDEFALLLPQRSLRDAGELLELLLRASTHSWSWGLTNVEPGDTLEDVLARADAQLYERKAKAHS